MPSVYTVCFCGTACARDEGEVTRYWDYKLLGLFAKNDQRLISHKDIFDKGTGYIPVRLHTEISTHLQDTKKSVTVRGVGENDWYDQMDTCDPLDATLPGAPEELRKYARAYSEGNQRTMGGQIAGWADAALALHAASRAAASGAEQYNFVGHSRGAVESIMAAWFLYAYGGEACRNIPINIFAIDPVPGTGEWYGIQTQLPPNVVNYVGVYAWDHLDVGFSAVIPRPNARMTQQREHEAIEGRGLGSTWQTLANNRQLADPLLASDLPKPEGYRLYATRGRHSTVAGIGTTDGLYDPKKFSDDVAAVPRLIYKMARGYLTRWGTTFHTKSQVRDTVRQLRKRIHTAHSHFDAMAGGQTRTSRYVSRQSVRRVSSIHGVLGWNKYYFEDVVGTPPYRLAYPCTIEQTGGGWVDWTFL
ncbi:Tat pathway signal protein [Myxococcus sp. CA051A]|uniref:Tat pathway signal protein n=1 Tax=unclassified Myxococcus TaxID=2648731 RepID=UPI00157B542B|nr:MULTISPECIES: Tat pathway signal protein [unclassified Myxococcus]NTX39814.1 Tat pathway signal protein [Myxococcus sp. CA033]NTX52907.1 Tat pathway signal protein [Myxococcus sp. CA039A]NTX65902.1 Tat pathway signal protein [Myxococcus sp. CA051A]